ncbi:MAG: hypothetical protein PHY80_00900, partial [Rickettsiales bacterium]|nr:hypothetical protein [Rickettsiales bacterium]
MFFNQSATFAANATSCYILIEGKAGCSGLTNINDITHTGQLKCFTIDKKAKDCGVFFNVLPSDTGQGLTTELESIDCTGSNKNSEECANYCYNNPAAVECLDCGSLTEAEKEACPYCQDEETAKYCDAESNDENGSSWPKTLAGVVNVTGTCLDGYEIDTDTGSPTRNCLSGGIWDSINAPCVSSKCTWSALNSLTYSTVGLTSTLLTSSNNWYDEIGASITKPTSAITYYDNGTVYQVACPTGYITTTKKKITCNNGVWSTTIADSCSDNACSTSTLTAYKSYYTVALANITIGASDTIAGNSTKTYTCDTGYTGSIVLSCGAGSVTGYTGSCSPTCTGSSLASKISNASQTGWYICPTNNTSCFSGGTVSAAATLYAQNTYAYLSACDAGSTISGTIIYKCTASNTWAPVYAGVCSPNSCYSSSLPSILTPATHFTNMLNNTVLANVSWYTTSSGTTTAPLLTVSGSSIYATCPTGYSTATRLVMQCVLGNWSVGLKGVCSANACSTSTLTAYKSYYTVALANITIGASDTIAGNSTKTYTCDT